MAAMRAGTAFASHRSFAVAGERLPPVTDPLSPLIEAIEAHLASHPQAADSAAGVACWWLAPQGVGAPLPQVEAALALLVQRQRLRRVRLADGSTLYGGPAAYRDDPAPGAGAPN